MTPPDTSMIGAVQREVERYAVECPQCGEWHESESPYRRGELIDCICGRCIDAMKRSHYSVENQAKACLDAAGVKYAD